jgi:phosphatidylglycerophosphate synthase
MPEGSPSHQREQDVLRGHRPRFGVADVFTAIRIPLAVLFVVLGDPVARLVILGVAGSSDLLDGLIARRFGSSRLGAFLDPVADKIFMAAAFGVVLLSGKLAWYEIAGVLLRDLVATIAFVVTYWSGRPSSIPARLGGKAVTLAQVLTLVAFLTDSPLLRPLAWATAGIAIYAIWDYTQAARKARRVVGT